MMAAGMRVSLLAFCLFLIALAGYAGTGKLPPSFHGKLMFQGGQGSQALPGAPINQSAVPHVNPMAQNPALSAPSVPPVPPVVLKVTAKIHKHPATSMITFALILAAMVWGWRTAQKRSDQRDEEEW